MSRFVIKNWAGDDGQVEVFDLRRWDTRSEAPSGIMFVRSDSTGSGIVPPEFEEAREAEWGDIESKASQVLDGDPSTLSMDAQRREALLDLMALHLLRSSEMFAVHIGLVARGAAKVLSEALADEDWDRVLEETGMSHEEALRSADAVIRNADPDVGLFQRIAGPLQSVCRSTWSGTAHSFRDAACACIARRGSEVFY